MDEEENKPEHFTNKLVNDRLDKATWKEKLYKETIEMLQTEERFVNYFEQYHPLCIEGFIKYYAQTKVGRYEYAEVMKKNRERKDNQFNILAEWALWGIQRHKVLELKDKFDKGLLKNEGVIYYDFSEWEEDPMCCPYIEPVNRYEIDLFLQFYDELWKEQDKYIEENGDPDEDDYYEDEDEMFVFSKDYVKDMRKICYRFDKFMKGGGEYYQRPNSSRGLKEGQWSYAARMEERAMSTSPPPIVEPVIIKPVKEIKPKEMVADDNLKKETKEEKVQPSIEPAKPANIEDRRRFLNGIQYEPHLYERFIRKFETNEVFQNYKSMHRLHDTSEFTERIDMDLYTLRDAKEHVPIERHDDWRRAVALACETFKRRKVREAIISWWEVYDETLLSKKKYEYINKMEPKKFDKSLREKQIEYIKRGRILDGETGDMDY